MRRNPLPMQNIVEFQKSVSLGPDGHGGQNCEWQVQFKTYAYLEFETGDESVQSARLIATSKITLTIRNSANARLVDHTWRILHRGQIYAVVEQPRPSPARDQIIMKLEGIS
jgi:SPP1 family predicted phage head-tail adaptor